MRWVIEYLIEHSWMCTLPQIRYQSVSNWHKECCNETWYTKVEQPQGVGKHTCIWLQILWINWIMTSSNLNIFRVTGPLWGNSPGNFPRKSQWHGVLVFSLICTWRNGWISNRKAGDLRRHRSHYDVTVMCRFIVYSIKYTYGFVMFCCGYIMMLSRLVTFSPIMSRCPWSPWRIRVILIGHLPPTTKHKKFSGQA